MIGGGLCMSMEEEDMIKHIDIKCQVFSTCDQLVVH